MSDRRRCDVRMDERGVALPLALFGLVAVSILVTSALLTSSTELALSRAHQAGVRSLHDADRSLEQFVAERAALDPDSEDRLANGEFDVNLPGGSSFSIAVSELYRGPSVTMPDGSVRRIEKYSLVASPSNGRGRSVGALIDVLRTSTPISFNIDAGLTSGTDTNVSGNAAISDGSTPGAACDSAVAGAGLRHAAGTTVSVSGNANINGGTVEDERDAGELIEYVLDGHDVDDLTALADIRFGPEFGEPDFSGNPSQNASDARYRWGCPAQMVGGCSAAQAAFFPTIAIDAGGGTINLNGNGYGQGVIVIVGGGLHISGNFKFAGVVLVEGSLRVSGNSKIEGAAIAMGDEVVIDPGEDGSSTGNSLIRYNRCQIANSLGGIAGSLETAPQSFDSDTYAWYEVGR